MEGFSHAITIALWAAIGSAACSFLIIRTHAWHGKFSLDHDLQGVQKVHKTPVPRIGGIALIFGAACGFIAAANSAHSLSAPYEAAFPYLFLFAATPVFLAGLFEDLTKKVGVTLRLGAAFVSALAASQLFDATVDSFDIWGFDVLLAYAPIAVAVTAFVVAGGINAINIIDGLNGFASGAGLVMLSGLGYLGWQHGDLLVVQLALIGIGAVAGFMLLNYPAGKIFLGDGGAYLLGFWISEIAVLLLARNDAVNAWQVLAICAYPIIEVLFTIYRRKIIRKKCAAHPDCLHLHTLLYRRVACKRLPFLVDKPWTRNASVASFVVCWTALAVLLAISMGDTVSFAAALVVLQVLLYLVMYARLVRGRWFGNQATVLVLLRAAYGEIMDATTPPQETARIQSKERFTPNRRVGQKDKAAGV